MKKKAIIAIVSMLTFGQGAWAQQPTPTTSFPLHGEFGVNSESNPYEIRTVEDLNVLAADVNSGNPYAGKYFKLTAEDDLDYTNKTFTPIGYGDDSDGKPFSGIFDGNGKTISGITVNTPEAWGVGLFGYISKATIKNLTITNSSFTANGFVGAIAGGSNGVDSHSNPTIYNCLVTSSVTVEAKDDNAAGGIIGITNDNIIIENCTSEADVSGSSCVGGIVGQVYNDNSAYRATLTNSYYIGTQQLPAIGVNGGDNGHATINITLLNDDKEATVKNATRISNYHGQTATVTLSGRTLYKDGHWNTLCLPFNVSTTTGLLSGDNVKAMTLNTLESNLTSSTLTLNFSDATSIPAGTPFIIKWNNTSAELTGLEFTGVTINKEPNNASVGEHVTFTGTYSPVVIGEGGDNTKLYLGLGKKQNQDVNTLFYPNAAMTIGAFRAYFQLLNGITASNPEQGGVGGSGARDFVLNFGDGETTSLSEEIRVKSEEFATAEEWYTLDGRRLSGKPSAKGLYINNDKKIVIK